MYYIEKLQRLDNKAKKNIKCAARSELGMLSGLSRQIKSMLAYVKYINEDRSNELMKRIFNIQFEDN